MNKKTGNNDIPDFSKVFDIDSDSLPSELIEKDPDASSKNLGFLSGDKDEALTEKEKKEKLNKEKADRKKKKINRLKNRMIIVLGAVVFLFVAITAISFAAKESKKPVVTLEKPVIQTISRYSEGNAVTVSSGKGYKLVFIDNDYDVHYIEQGQTVEITDENGTLHTGKITDIKEASPDSYYIKNYFSVLTGEMPSTAVYAVFVTPDDDSVFTKEGIPLRVKVLTKTAADALTISASAVFTDGNQSYVWKYSSFSKTLEKQDVKTGLTVDGKTQIQGGIDKSDKIVISFSCAENKIYDGIKVKTE